MKRIAISTSVNAEPEDILEAIELSDLAQIIEHFGYSDQRDEIVLNALGFSESEYLAQVSDHYMNRYIKDNISYYDATSDMQDEIDRLKRQLEAKKEPEIKLPDYPHKAKEFFCDLFGFGYHVSSSELIKKFSSTIY